jgi:hypothetical protein
MITVPYLLHAERHRGVVDVEASQSFNHFVGFWTDTPRNPFHRILLAFIEKSTYRDQQKTVVHRLETLGPLNRPISQA